MPFCGIAETFLLPTWNLTFWWVPAAQIKRHVEVIRTVQLANLRKLKCAGRVRLCEVLGAKYQNYYKASKQTWNHFIGNLGPIQEAFLGSSGFTRSVLAATKYDAIQEGPGGSGNIDNMQEQALAVYHLPQHLLTPYAGLFKAVYQKPCTECLPPIKALKA